MKNQLAACEPIKRDIIVMTDWMAARMIGLGWIQPLDASKVPNLHKNLIPALRKKPWDPDEKYHAPWQSGLTGIAYNADKTDEVKSFTELLTRSDLKGKITLLTEMRDTMGFMLRTVGANPEKFTDAQWQNAIDSLHKSVSDGQVRSFNGNDYLNDLASGNTLACEAWSGDVIIAQQDNPNLKFVTPEEGLSLWADNMLDPEPGDPPVERRGVDQLLLRAQGGGAARELQLVHLPGRGGAGGDAQDPRRGEAGREPADLPRREDAGEHLRLHGAGRPAGD